MDKLQELQQILAEEGRDRVQQEVQDVRRNVLREVCKAAQLPVAASDGRTMLVSELRSALLAIGIQCWYPSSPPWNCASRCVSTRTLHWHFCQDLTVA